MGGWGMQSGPKGDTHRIATAIPLPFPFPLHYPTSRKGHTTREPVIPTDGSIDGTIHGPAIRATSTEQSKGQAEAKELNGGRETGRHSVLSATGSLG